MCGAIITAAAALIGGMQDAAAADDQADYNAAVARNNQIIAQNNALQARYNADFEEQHSRADAQRRMAAAFASKSGVTPDGAPLAVLGAAAAEAELDAQAVRYGGASQAAARNQGAAARQQADLAITRDRRAADRARLGGVAGALGAIASAW